MVAHGKCCRRLGGRAGGPGGLWWRLREVRRERGCLQRPRWGHCGRAAQHGVGWGAEVPGQTGWRAPERWCFLGKRWGGWEGLR